MPGRKPCADSRLVLRASNGVIDGSVLRAVGEIFAYATLWVVWSAIKSGIDARLTHGNTKIEFGDLNKTEVDNEENID